MVKCCWKKCTILIWCGVTNSTGELNPMLRKRKKMMMMMKIFLSEMMMKQNKGKYTARENRICYNTPPKCKHTKNSVCIWMRTNFARNKHFKQVMLSSLSPSLWVLLSLSFSLLFVFSFFLHCSWFSFGIGANFQMKMNKSVIKIYRKDFLHTRAHARTHSAYLSVPL